MVFRKLIPALLMILLVSSCALKKDAVKKDEALQPAKEEFKLPDVELEQKAEPQKKLPHQESVLINVDEEEKYILLNFENTDIKTIISTFSELLDINYILAPGVSGSVTVQSYKKFPLKDIFNIFQSILEINGLTAVKEGSFYKIVPIDAVKQQPLDVEKGKEISVTLGPTFITQLIPLEKVKAADISAILRGLMPRGTDIIIYEPANLLIVTALPRTLAKFMKLIEALDISETETEAIRTYVYHVENGEAKKLETILKAMYPETAGAVKPAVSSAAPQTPARAARPAQAQRTAEEATGLPGVIGEVTITAYEDINALIIKCNPRTYISLLEVLKRIDIPPKQVLIEVMMLELTLTDSFKFGLEWLMKTAGGDVVGLSLGSIVSGAGAPPPTAIPPTTPNFPGGFGAVIKGSPGDSQINSVLQTLATESKVNVLASPHILAMDNKDASIEIGDEVPTATGTTQSAEGTVTTAQIQYKTVGIILKVKPRITEKDMVTLDVSQEVSQAGAEYVIANQKYQGFSTRKTKTTATVESGHTLILGGLIRKNLSDGRSGIPFLSKIPIIGYLFSSINKSSNKTELLVLVTPHVINNQEDADSITREFQNRVKTIKKTLKEIEEREEKERKEKEEAEKKKIINN